jgi:hypothetical protein
VRAWVDPYPDEVFEGKVTIVVRAVDPRLERSWSRPGSRTDERLKPGLFARVELDLLSDL